MHVLTPTAILTLRSSVTNTDDLHTMLTRKEPLGRTAAILIAGT